ncbi:hypothetical protein HN51_044521, partial [Arachis hypogaea]
NFEKKLKVHETIIKKEEKSPLLSTPENFTKTKDLIRPDPVRFITAYLTLTCFHDHKRTIDDY